MFYNPFRTTDLKLSYRLYGEIGENMHSKLDEWYKELVNNGKVIEIYENKKIIICDETEYIIEKCDGVVISITKRYI